MASPASTPFLALGTSRFVALTTFRKTGAGVTTTVWIARDGDDLLVTTPAGAGKVKRLRNDPRVELQPSGRMGAVADDAVKFAGVSRIVDDPAESARLTQIFRAKYGLEYRIFLFMERRFSKGENTERVLVRISPAS
ncbi:PPOX class F420-dependent oxidoreductase [soil metagenome]